MVHLNVPAGVKVTYGFGFMPRANAASGTAVASGAGVRFRVPEGATDVYVTLESVETAEYAMTFEDENVIITSVMPALLPSSGEVTMTINGAGFVSGNHVVLSHDGVDIIPVSIQYVDAGTVTATIDCSTLAPGACYDVKVIGVENNAIASDVVSVAKVEGKGQLEAKLVLPDIARQGRVGMGYVEYANVGTADMDVPIFKIKGAKSGTLVSMSSEVSSMTDKLMMVGIGEGYPAGVLKAGQHNRLPFYFMVGSRYELKLAVVDSESDVLRNSIYESWQEFCEAIANATTELNRTGECFDYGEIYAAAMRAGTGNPVTRLCGAVSSSRTGLPYSEISVCVWDTNNTMVAEVKTDQDGRFVVGNLRVDQEYAITSTDCQLKGQALGWCRLLRLH